MEYAQLNVDLTEATQVATNGNVFWGDAHFCPAANLTLAEADALRVVYLKAVPAPVFDAYTQRCVRNGCEKVNGQWQYAWVVTALSAEEIATTLAIDIKAAMLKIDVDTDAIYGKVLGNRAEEYISASNDAQAYKNAEYSGVVPPGVQSWATAKGWTATQATDSILATTMAWKGAQGAIRSARLVRKEQIRAATDETVLNTAMTAWTAFTVYIRNQLGI